MTEDNNSISVPTKTYFGKMTHTRKYVGYSDNVSEKTLDIFTKNISVISWLSKNSGYLTKVSTLLPILELRAGNIFEGG